MILIVLWVYTFLTYLWAVYEYFTNIKNINQAKYYTLDLQGNIWLTHVPEIYKKKQKTKICEEDLASLQQVSLYFPSAPRVFVRPTQSIP